MQASRRHLAPSADPWTLLPRNPTAPFLMDVLISPCLTDAPAIQRFAPIIPTLAVDFSVLMRFVQLFVASCPAALQPVLTDIPRELFVRVVASIDFRANPAPFEAYEQLMATHLVQLPSASADVLTAFAVCTARLPGLAPNDRLFKTWSAKLAGKSAKTAPLRALLAFCFGVHVKSQVPKICKSLGTILEWYRGAPDLAVPALYLIAELAGSGCDIPRFADVFAPIPPALAGHPDAFARIAIRAPPLRSLIFGAAKSAGHTALMAAVFDVTLLPDALPDSCALIAAGVSPAVFAAFARADPRRAAAVMNALIAGAPPLLRSALLRDVALLLLFLADLARADAAALDHGAADLTAFLLLAQDRPQLRWFGRRLLRATGALCGGRPRGFFLPGSRRSSRRRLWPPRRPRGSRRRAARRTFSPATSCGTRSAGRRARTPR
jgi:hypothetical protein